MNDSKRMVVFAKFCAIKGQESLEKNMKITRDKDRKWIELREKHAILTNGPIENPWKCFLHL